MQEGRNQSMVALGNELLPTPSHHSGALQGALLASVYLMLSLKSKHLKNSVYFDKNLGIIPVLSLLEGRETNHCFYKNVFTRKLEKCKHMLGGGEEFLGQI